jgi:catechol 2,3-dioxygenase-like lactoylglutathione lyase family enzyme
MSNTQSTGAVADASARPVICPKLHHTGALTTRVEEMADWYAKVLGMTVVLRSANSGGIGVSSIYVTNDDAHHRHGFQNPPGGLIADPDEVRKYSRIGHYAWEYDSLDDLLISWDRISVEHGIDPVGCVDHGVSFAFYYKDPDNNTVELLADAYGDHEESLRRMGDERMVSNPMGRWVDPARLLEEQRKGATLSELHERSMAGEFEPAVTPDARKLL